MPKKNTMFESGIPRRATPNLSAEIYAPFNGMSEEKIRETVRDFVETTGLERYDSLFLKGAFLAQDDESFGLDFNKSRDDGLRLSEEERECLNGEKVVRKGWNVWKFNQPWALWRLVALCALGAAVQGWDEAAVAGAQIYYQYAFGIDGQTDNNAVTLGFVNGAPYLCCVFSCWLTQPLNAYLGRRGTIFLACLFSAGFCLGQAFSWNWQTMFAFRFLLGLGIGPKSATIPIYASECAPANVRGALVMMWQVFTAFGIMCGYLASVAFRNVLSGGNETVCPPAGNLNYANHSNITGYPMTLNGTNETYIGTFGQGNLQDSDCSLNWRLMIASPMVAPIILAMYIYTQPESPRWLLAKAAAATLSARTKDAHGYYREVFQSLTSLRNSELQASRDMILIYHLLRKEDDVLRQKRTNTSWYQRGVSELFTVRRNRRAVVASLIVMFFQQFCGINVLIYYSTYVLTHAGYSAQNALLYSMGVGIINFTCALPAFYTIDTFGRRNLLLTTFPFLALFQLLSAIAFFLPAGIVQQRLVIVGMYLFGIAYSPGEGPVPFVYAAESMPLYIRELGMGLVTSVNWLFNFVIAVTVPPFVKAFTEKGTFLWYFAWCIVGWFLIFSFVPETKGLELEELDAVFEGRTGEFLNSNWNDLACRAHLRQRGRPRAHSQNQHDINLEMNRLPTRVTTTGYEYE